MSLLYRMEENRDEDLVLRNCIFGVSTGNSDNPYFGGLATHPFFSESSGIGSSLIHSDSEEGLLTTVNI